MKTIDLNYYKTVVETQTDPEILKVELQDLITEIEEINSSERSVHAEVIQQPEPTLEDMCNPKPLWSKEDLLRQILWDAQVPDDEIDDAMGAILKLFAG